MPSSDLETVIDTALRHLNHVETPWLVSIAAELKDMLTHCQSNRRVLRDFIIERQAESQVQDILYGPIVLWADVDAAIIATVQQVPKRKASGLVVFITTFILMALNVCLAPWNS